MATVRIINIGTERVLFFVFSENTPPDASLTGSMQLLAGVKLCTNRHITNHPHYENKFLRERTKQVSGSPGGGGSSEIWKGPLKGTKVPESGFVGVARIPFHPKEVPILKQN